MKSCGNVSHRKLKSFGRCFVEFWHEYFLSTGLQVRDLPIKQFMSATDLLSLWDLSSCTCSNLIKNLYSSTLSCEYCRKKYTSRTRLNAHIYHHKLRKMRRFECPFCLKNFEAKVGLLRHMELHTAEYTCEPCKQALHALDIERHNKTRKHLENVKRFERKPKRCAK